MAHIIKRGPKHYEIRIEAGRDPKTGERKRIYKNFRGTKKEAEQYMAELLKQGENFKKGNIKLAKYLNVWLDNYKSNISDSTAKDYKSIIDNHLIPYFGGINLNDLKPIHIDNYQRKKLENGRLNGSGGLSGRTVQAHHRLLSLALKDAVRKYDILDKNPCKAIKAPAAKSRNNALNKDEVNKILNNCEGILLYTLFYFATYTGLRRSEITGLQWQDMNWNKQILNVQRAGRVVEGEFKYQPAKTDKSNRQVMLDKETIKVVKNYKKERAALLDGDDPVFITPEGYAVRPDYITKKFKQICKELNMGDYRFHDLRHTHATWMLEAGVNPKVVQERLGHSRIETTLNIYSHVSINEQEKAVQKLRKSADF